jgi:microcystin-dependent protein
VIVKQLFANNASTMLATSIDDIETVLQVDSTFGALFPDPASVPGTLEEYFVIALENNLGDIEICKVTSRTGDLLTIVRGWEGTVPQSWTGGQTRVETRNTAGSMRRMIQRGGDTMEGDLYMAGNTIHDATLEGDTVIINAMIQGGVITNINGDSCNALVIPDDCGSPTVGGSPILTVNNFDPGSVFEPGMIMMWYGQLTQIPAGWALCDGNNGRPDLRDRFIVGAGAGYSLGDTGGTATHSGLATTAAGGHSHGGSTAQTELTEANIPAHSHRLWVLLSGVSSVANADPFNKNVAVVGDELEGGRVHTYASKTNNGTGQQIIEPTGTSEAASHDHDISAEANHTHAVTFDNRPPYFGLFFIIKVDPSGSYGGIGPGGGGNTMYDMYSETGCVVHIGGQSTLMDDTPTVGGNIQINCCASNVHRVVLTQNSAMLAPNNPISGQVINIILKQGGAGGYTVTWNAVFKWAGGVPPTLSTAVGARDIITCQYDSADNVWYCTATNNFS